MKFETGYRLLNNLLKIQYTGCWRIDLSFLFFVFHTLSVNSRLLWCYYGRIQAITLSSMWIIKIKTSRHLRLKMADTEYGGYSRGIGGGWSRIKNVDKITENVKMQGSTFYVIVCLSKCLFLKTSHLIFTHFTHQDTRT